MKYLIIILFAISLTLIGLGIYFYIISSPKQHLFFGIGTMLLFFVTMPVFLFYRRKKIDLQKYSLDNFYKAKDEKKESL